MKRRIFLATAALVALSPLRVLAQAPRRPLVGFLATGSKTANARYYIGFPQGMRELGYAEGKNYLIEWRFADGQYDVFPKLAAELVGLKVDIIVTGTPGAIRAIQQATSTVPIVMAYSTDPVGDGLVESLARPGGNTTGLASSLDESVPKQMELIAAVVPDLKRVGIVSNPQNPQASALATAKVAARSAGLDLVSVNAKNAQELTDGFTTLVKERVGATIVLSDAYFNGERSRIAELAISHRVPTIFAQRQYVAAGGLMSYGETLADFFRRSALYVDKIIKGARPGDLPVEQPTRFFLVINLKTTNSLGLSIPPALLARADEVIE